MSARELGATAGRHFTTAKLDLAGADVVNAYLGLDLVRAWGDGTTVAADGTQVDTLIDNLLAESHIRYGGYGGIGLPPRGRQLHRPVQPLHPLWCLGGGLRHRGAAPERLRRRARHDPCDTQGESYPVHALAHLFGFELLPRIRNWKDLIFYRSAPDVRYRHIDSLFGEAGQNTISWRLIETHWRDLMQVVLSIREGRLSSTLLLRRLGTESRKNNVYKAFRELGRVIRTITQGGGLQRVLGLADVRPGRHRAQRPGRAGEDHQAQHPGGQTA